MSNRDDAGRFQPGGPAGPGRPQGFRHAARKIMRETKDGAELVEFALRVMRDEAADMPERLRALDWLSAYGLGKPVARHELEAHVTAVGAGRLDVRALAAAIPAELVAAMNRALDERPDLVLPSADDEEGAG